MILPILHPPARLATALLCGMLAVGTVSGCTQVPELNETVTDDLRDTAYPELVPLETTLAPEPAPQDEAEQLENLLNGRRDRLQSRAEALQAQVIDDETRKRMDAGITR